MKVKKRRKKKLLLKDLKVMIAKAMIKKKSLKRYFVKIRELFFRLIGLVNRMLSFGSCISTLQKDITWTVSNVMYKR